MMPEEFKAKMLEIYGEYPEYGSYDEEAAHVDADDLLCEALESLGYQEGVRLFKQALRWYA